MSIIEKVLQAIELQKECNRVLHQLHVDNESWFQELQEQDASLALTVNRLWPILIKQSAIKKE